MNDSQKKPSEKPVDKREDILEVLNRKYGKRKPGEIIGYEIIPRTAPPFIRNGEYIEPIKIPIYAKKPERTE